MYTSLSVLHVRHILYVYGETNKWCDVEDNLSMKQKGPLLLFPTDELGPIWSCALSRLYIIFS